MFTLVDLSSLAYLRILLSLLVPITPTLECLPIGFLGINLGPRGVPLRSSGCFYSLLRGEKT